MYVLTECAFLTPRSSAIWLDSDDRKKLNCKEQTRRNQEVFDVKWSSRPKRKTEVVPCHLGTTISMSKNILGFATKLRTPLYSYFTLVKRCYNCGLSFNFLYRW